MFMHNGQIGGWGQLRRRVEAMIPDHHYTARQGTTDSEALFLVAQAALPAASPVDAMADALARVHALMLADGIKAPLRFSAAMTDGTDLYAFRWSSDSAAPTVYFSEADGDITVVSEPIDRVRERWHEVPPGHALVARRDKQAEIVAFDPLARAMAA
jgi:glutamine amidotransferase